jgi:hypothetical protein
MQNEGKYVNFPGLAHSDVSFVFFVFVFSFLSVFQQSLLASPAHFQPEGLQEQTGRRHSTQE